MGMPQRSAYSMERSPSALATPGPGVLVFSQYIETRYAADMLGAASGAGAAGVGYLNDIASLFGSNDRVNPSAGGMTVTSVSAGTLDEAYERLHATGPEFDGFLSNQGPM